ncbi:hypothetical protein J4227_04885 [Candidatus Woesearchaeota archaeon]|nr:hypothetical protein [Candidatus Woesearchaeota archaeon]
MAKRKAKAAHGFLQGLKSSFLESWRFREPFLKNLGLDVLGYSIFFLIIILFFVMTDQAFGAMNAFEQNPDVQSPELIAQLAASVTQIKAIGIIGLILILINWMFWRAFILQAYFRNAGAKGQSRIQLGRTALLLGIFKFIMLGLIGSMALLFEKTLNPNAIPVIGAGVMLVFFYAYAAFVFGLASQKKFADGMKACWRLAKSWDYILPGIFIAWLMLVMISWIGNLLEKLPEMAFVFSYLVLLLLYLNWARHFMALNALRALDKK